MTPTEVRLVQESFAHVVPIQDTAAGLFYARLFDIDPTTGILFAESDFKRQGAKLMAALAMVVEGLDRPETILPLARDLGRRHVDYGVTEPHYASVGAALLWTLRTGLEERFTPEVERAWAVAYALLSSVMLGGALDAQVDKALPRAQTSQCRPDQGSSG